MMKPRMMLCTRRRKRSHTTILSETVSRQLQKLLWIKFDGVEDVVALCAKWGAAHMPTVACAEIS